jgi:hypothetical protein
MEGVFLGAKKKHQLLLSLTLLQRAVAIQVDESSVVAIRARAAVKRLRAETTL